MSEFSKEELFNAVSEWLPEFPQTGAVERLSGGNINHVWCVGGEKYNVIAKHAPSHIASNPDVPLSNDRIDFEARALSLFKSGGPLHDMATHGIRPPKLLAFDPERSLLIMEDLIEFTELGQADIRTVLSHKSGERLGKFIGKLHLDTFGDNNYQSSFSNLEIQKVRNQLQYRPAHEYANLGDKTTESRIKNRSRDLGDRLLGTGKCLVMGDLWPPSLFVNDRSDVRLIDWEFVHFGRPLQDVGHMAAHCWMNRQVQNSRSGSDWWGSLWTSFWSAYKKATGSIHDELFNADEKQDIGIHIGTEILIRTFGPFKEGYRYDSVDENHPLLRDAKTMAVECILQPDKAEEIFGFKNS